MRHLIATLCLTAAASHAGHAQQDILTTAASSGSFDTLVSLLVAADLEDALDDGTFTVFAPTDAAFAALPAETLASLRLPENREQLRGILTYHVLDSLLRVPEQAPAHPVTRARTLQGADVSFRREGHSVFVNDAKIVQRDLRCSNGIIQVVDQVLLPPPAPRTLVDVAREAEGFDTLLAAVEAAGLSDALTGEGPLTLFAPTDEAFAKLPKGALEDLLRPENEARLAALLTNHVVAGALDARALARRETVEPLGGGSLGIAIEGGALRVGDARVVSNDIAADNGVIHVIDSVLTLPPGSSDARSSATATTPRVVELSATWDHPIAQDGLVADRVVIRCAGGASVNLTNVDAAEIETRVYGGGSVSISGRAASHTATVNGGGVLEAGALETGATDVGVNSGGRASVFARDRLNLRANAWSQIRYADTGVAPTGNVNPNADVAVLAH